MAQPAKLSRQQLRAQAREKHDAQGWINALQIDDPYMKQAIRRALGNRHLTRTELENALGVSLAPFATRQEPAVSTNEPERITIQHILISFAGSGTRATRSREEASALAAETLARIQAGADFDALVAEMTDDSAPGIYSLANTNVAPQNANEYPRNRMVSAFGDVGFGLDVGQVGMADFDARTSPYGWHIIKRLK
jgi:hypothetical protein